MIVCFAAAVASVSFVPASVTPVTGAAIAPEPELSAIEVFDVADRAQDVGHNEEAIRLYDALAQDRDADVRAEARFRKGMLLARLPRYREAATALCALLDEKPDAARVRLVLAQVLALMGDEGGARRELRQVQATGLPENVAQAIGQFDTALRSPKRAGLRLELALTPGTNINRATEVRSLDTIIAPLTLFRDARAQSGIGVHMSGEGYRKIPVGGGVSVVPRLNSLATFYGKSAYNDITVTGLVRLEVQRKHNRFTASGGHGWRWYGKLSYMHMDVASVDWIHALNPTAQLNGSLSAAKTDFQLNDLQDGTLFSLSLGVDKALSVRSGLSMTLNAARQSARDPGYATASGGVRLVGWREAGHTTLFATIALQRTEGDAALLLFGTRRREWFASARAGATLLGCPACGGGTRTPETRIMISSVQW